MIYSQRKEVTMSDLYWITVLGNIGDVSVIFLFVGVVASMVLSVMYLMESDDCDYGLTKNSTISIIRKYRNAAFVMTSVSLLLTLFTPSKKELYMIYGIGGTIDYLRENPTAKKLPGKCIKAIDKWVDKTLENDKKEGDE